MTDAKNPLALPGQVSGNALILPQKLTEDEWKDVGTRLATAQSGVMWWLGDWWAFGDKKEYGARKAFAEALEKSGGFSFQTCMNAASVSRGIETSRRREVLPWTYHQEVAGLELEAQDKALDWAEDLWPNVTHRELRGHVRSLKRRADFSEAEQPQGKYRVLYADPPWEYGNERPLSAGDQDDHYPPMPTQAICALPVADWAIDNSVLFMWTTSAMLHPDAFQVIEAWGFQYKTTFVWDKVKHNMGHYNSVRHEILIVAVKGNCTPDVRKLFDSVVTEERTEHSVKPSIFYEIIETLYPNGKRLELFCRRPRDGWEAYGNEV